MDAALRQLVRQRAGNACEYCGLRQEHDRFRRFHVEHIVARQHRGPDSPENLALAYHQCNLHKGTNLTGVDPDTGEVVLLFHPRREIWTEHFARQGIYIAGKTSLGRTTAWLLQMNSEARLELRRLLLATGELD